MRWAVLSIVAAGCGRIGFDASARDAGDDAVADTSGDAVASLLVGCVLWMPMEEPGALPAIPDRCGGDNPGTATTGVTAATDPVRGRVIELAGGTSCVQVADAANLRGGSAFTISAWVRPDAVTTSSYGIVSKRVDYMVDTAYAVFLWASNDGTGPVNHVYVDVDGETQRFEEPSSTFLGTWRQITIVFDGAAPTAQRIAIHVDGVRTAVAPEAATDLAVPTTPPPVSIGCLPLGSPAQALLGGLDDVAIWSRALPPADVAAWYEATRRP